MNSPLNILVIEDNHDLCAATVELLASLGHHVRGVDCAEALPEQEGSPGIDLAVVDLNLPGEDGLLLAQRLRRVQPGIGIIMVTARSAMPERLAGYAHGADHYLAKPTDPQELCAAVQALGWRLRAPKGNAVAVQLHLPSFALQGTHGEHIQLTPPECALLAALVRAADQRLKNWQLMEVLGNSDAVDRKAALEIVVVRLRKKLQQAGATQSAIKSIRSWGYQLCLQLQLRDA